jgi:hypothetical protein
MPTVYKIVRRETMDIDGDGKLSECLVSMIRKLLPKHLQRTYMEADGTINTVDMSLAFIDDEQARDFLSKNIFFLGSKMEIWRATCERGAPIRRMFVSSQLADVQPGDELAYSLMERADPTDASCTPAPPGTVVCFNLTLDERIG